MKMDQYLTRVETLKGVSVRPGAPNVAGCAVSTTSVAATSTKSGAGFCQFSHSKNLSLWPRPVAQAVAGGDALQNVGCRWTYSNHN